MGLPGRFAFRSLAQIQRLPADPHLRQPLDDRGRQLRRKPDQRVLGADIHTIDLRAQQLRLIGDGPDDVPGVRAVPVADRELPGLLFAVVFKRECGGVQLDADIHRHA